MCNLYSSTLLQAAMQGLFPDLTDRAGNLEPGQVFPEQPAPIVCHDGEGLELVRARWSMLSPPSVLKTARDPDVTNVRNLGSSHWRMWLGRDHRCLTAVTSFAEALGMGRGNQGSPQRIRTGRCSSPGSRCEAGVRCARSSTMNLFAEDRTSS